MYLKIQNPQHHDKFLNIQDIRLLAIYKMCHSEHLGF